MTQPGTGGGGDYSLDELLARAQTEYPPAPDHSRDTFASWKDVLGNRQLKVTLRTFVRRPYTARNHVLVYGANRSGKTWIVHLACQAKFCRQRDETLAPCQQCDSCLKWQSGAGYRDGRYFNGAESFEYRGVNCTAPGGFDEEAVLGHRDQNCPLILFLDEVASSAFATSIPKLLKPMTEQPITVLACGVRVKSVRAKKGRRARPGLPDDFLYRFPHILKTTTAERGEFIVWLERQCQRRALQVEDLSALELVYDRSRAVPGQALRPLDRAAFLGVPLTRAFIEEFRWDAE